MRNAFHYDAWIRCNRKDDRQKKKDCRNSIVYLCSSRRCDDYIFLHGDMGNLQSVSSVECYAGGFMSDNDILLHRPAQGCG